MSKPKSKQKSNGDAHAMSKRELQGLQQELLKSRMDGFAREYDELVRKWGIVHVPMVKSVPLGNNLWGQAGEFGLAEVDMPEEEEDVGSES